MLRTSLISKSFCSPLFFGAALSMLLLAGCDSAQVYDAGPSAPGTDAAAATAPLFTTPGFYFLPPMVSNPTPGGTFDAELSPVVQVCETPACDDVLASYSMSQGDGSEVVRMEEDDEHYIVNWHSGHTGASAGQTYRVQVLVNDLVLGYADIAVVSTGREAVTAGSDGSIALVAGQTLPVKFRIETGIVGAVVVTPETATIGVDETQQFTASLLDLHGVQLEGPAVSWSSDEPNVAEIDSDGLATGMSVGEAVIMASSGPASGNAQLSVVPDVGEPVEVVLENHGSCAAIGQLGPGAGQDGSWFAVVLSPDTYPFTMTHGEITLVHNPVTNCDSSGDFQVRVFVVDTMAPPSGDGESTPAPVAVLNFSELDNPNELRILSFQLDTPAVVTEGRHVVFAIDSYRSEGSTRSCIATCPIPKGTHNYYSLNTNPIDWAWTSWTVSSMWMKAIGY